MRILAAMAVGVFLEGKFSDRLRLRAVRNRDSTRGRHSPTYRASSGSRNDFQAAYSGVSNSLLRSRGFISSFHESMPISVESAAAKNGAWAAAAILLMSRSNCTSTGTWLNE